MRKGFTGTAYVLSMYQHRIIFSVDYEIFKSLKDVVGFDRPAAAAYARVLAKEKHIFGTVELGCFRMFDSAHGGPFHPTSYCSYHHKFLDPISTHFDANGVIVETLKHFSIKLD